MSTFVDMARADMKKSWWGFLLLGIVLIILGSIALAAPLFVSIVTVIFLGYLLIVGGALQAIHAFWRRRWSGFFLDLLTGILYLVVGIMCVTHPVESTAQLTLLLAAWLIVAGVFRIIAGISGQLHHWFWVLLHGVITLVLGISIWQNWPWPALQVIGIFVGIDLLLNGWTLIMLAFSVKKMPA